MIALVVALVVFAVAIACHVVGFSRGWDHGERWAAVRLTDLERENGELRARLRHPAGRDIPRQR